MEKYEKHTHWFGLQIICICLDDVNFRIGGVPILLSFALTSLDVVRKFNNVVESY